MSRLHGPLAHLLAAVGGRVGVAEGGWIDVFGGHGVPLQV